MLLMRGSTLGAAGLLALGLSLGSLGFGRPIGQDDTYHLMAARLLASEGSIRNDGTGGLGLRTHPPLYPWLVRLAQGLLGPEVWAARVVGWIAYGFTGVILFRLVLSLGPAGTEGRAAALLSLLLYLSIPAAIQGTALVDIDAAVLPAWTVLWIGMHLTLVKRRDAMGMAGLAVATALGWGLKFSTPVVVMALGALSLAAARESRPALPRAWAAIALGTAAFAVAYVVWGRERGLGLGDLVRYVVERAISGGTAGVSGPGEIAKNAGQFALWTSPFFLLLSVGGVTWGLLGTDWRRRMLAAMGGALLLGYLVVGGTPFGFPRYHAPVLPLLCALAGLWIAPSLQGVGRRFWWAAVGMLLLVIAWNLLVVGDLLFTLRYAYRGAAAAGDPRAAALLGSTVWRGIALLAPALAVAPAIGYLVRTRAARVHLALLGLVLGGFLALDAIQAVAPFGIYQYGEAGTQDAARFLQARLASRARVIATREILFYLDKLEDPARRPLGAATWDDPRGFLAELNDPRLGGVVYGIAANTIGQYRRVFRDPAVRQTPETRFRREEIGGYTVWWRPTSVSRRAHPRLPAGQGVPQQTVLAQGSPEGDLESGG